MAHGGLQAVQIWTQIPVASRTVEVNTKTGFSLTAGSYVVRASSSQRGDITVATGVNSNTATVASVTTTRAHLIGTWRGVAATVGYGLSAKLTSTTVVTADRESAPADYSIMQYDLMELF